MSEDVRTVEPIHRDEPIHFPTLDAVRFLAFLAVFLSHYLPPVLRYFEQTGPLGRSPVRFSALANAGGFGVDLFLVLSAFLITSLLLRERDANGTIKVGSFYMRRMLRIWPLYLVFLAAMFIVSRMGFTAPGFQPLAAGYWIAFLLLVGNWFTGLVGYPNGNIDPLWSVSLEEQFYLFWPWLLLLFRRSLVTACVALFAVSMAARVWVAWMGLPHPAMWVFTITRLDPILLGAILAVANRQKLLPALSSAVQWTLFLGGFAMWPIVHGLFRINGDPFKAAVITFPVAAFASAAILLAAVVSTGSLRRFLLRPWMIHMGSLSYGTYVLHYLTLNLAEWALSGLATGLGLLLYGPLAFVLAWLGAEASFRWLESPFLRLRRRFRPEARAVPLAARPAADHTLP